MKVLQVIDSLRPGGAENMAVNLANLLVNHVEGSYLCCTRESGVLEERLNPDVIYLCLNKRNSLDVKALLRFSDFIRKNNIDIVHAHSTSYFFSCLAKFLNPGLKIVWHDHYGESENVSKRREPILKLLSRYFAGILVVNGTLEKWVRNNFYVANIKQLKNFVQLYSDENHSSNFEFLGNGESFKIICVANLRPQKNHLVLLKAFEKLQQKNISLHLFGDNPDTIYSRKVLRAIENSRKSDRIFFYGVQQNITSILPKAQIGVLPSRSEGLPLVLLEYSLAGLPIICTRVGQNEEVVGDFGKVVEPNNSELLAEAIVDYLDNIEKRRQDSSKLKTKIEKEYNPSVIRKDLLKFYNLILD
ncbi:glycosyltransferase [Christiangramia echinicola]|uniref:Glycosyltransferase involved in cell wall bisynthesis n=1 Tax=Christiangramia echinicola TaxID=279359 RepID=A0A1H1L2S4_9FLAO|nr:glycosyltransferase [Christiangramia echinicola]SDR68826.1 Glycosyltransferase involved in cell wall bisynthesis [Christiangramia echinicola]